MTESAQRPRQPRRYRPAVSEPERELKAKLSRLRIRDRAVEIGCRTSRAGRRCCRVRAAIPSYPTVKC